MSRFRHWPGVSWRELHLNFADYRFGFLLHAVQAMYWADHFPNDALLLTNSGFVSNVDAAWQ